MFKVFSLLSLRRFKKNRHHSRYPVQTSRSAIIYYHRITRDCWGGKAEEPESSTRLQPRASVSLYISTSLSQAMNFQFNASLQGCSIVLLSLYQHYTIPSIPIQFLRLRTRENLSTELATALDDCLKVRHDDEADA
jgi:hypothetical protein